MTKKTNKTELEIVTFRNSRLDKVLKDCLSVMEMPKKWSIDKDGKIIHVYPHPIVTREAYRVKGIQYLPHKSFMLPDVLLERLIHWEEVQENWVVKGKNDITQDDVLKWQELRMQGKSYTKIAEMAGVTAGVVSYRLKKLQVSTEAV